jgi:ABC-type branched-subunit amino acid transport system substrate-binding protein
MKKLMFIALSLILVSALVLVGCPSPAPETTQPPQTTQPPETTQPPKTLKIGFLACLTGFLSSKDIPDLNMAIAAKDVLNEKGGITVQGQQYMIEFIIEDYETSFDGLTAATNRLVYDHGVDFMIGPTAFFASGVGPIANPEKVIYVIDYCNKTPGEMDATTPYGFLGSNSAVGKMMGSVKYLAQAYPEVEKVAVVMPDDGGINFLGPVFETIFAEEGLTWVGDPVLYPNEMQDFSPIVSKINLTEEAEAICHMNGVAQHIGAIVKGLRESGNTKPYAGMMCATMNDIVAIAGLEAAQDVFMASTSADEAALPPLGKEIIQRYIDEHGSETSLIMYAANCLYMLKQAIEGADSLDTDVVKTYWESMDAIDTLEGPGVMCGDETYGIHHHAVAHPQPIQILDENGNAVSGGLMDIGVIP